MNNKSSPFSNIDALAMTNVYHSAKGMQPEIKVVNNKGIIPSPVSETQT